MNQASINPNNINNSSLQQIQTTPIIKLASTNPDHPAFSDPYHPANHDINHPANN